MNEDEQDEPIDCEFEPPIVIYCPCGVEIPVGELPLLHV